MTGCLAVDLFNYRCDPVRGSLYQARDLSIDTISGTMGMGTGDDLAVVAGPCRCSAAWVDHNIELVARAKVVNTVLMRLGDIVADAGHAVATVV